MDGLVEDICLECHSSSFAEHCTNVEYKFVELVCFIAQTLFTTVHVIPLLILRVCNKVVICREGFLKLVTPEKYILSILQMYNSLDASVAQRNITIVTCLFFDSVHIPLLNWSRNILDTNDDVHILIGFEVNIILAPKTS